MASVGHPLIGDPVYGRNRSEHRDVLRMLDFKRQALHAAHLGFVHPVTSAAMSFESKLPHDMQALFTALRI
jgi:23S rRNA pseudouridine1911/1915/1917 synthase